MKKWICLILVVILCLSGCGKAPGELETILPQEETAVELANPPDLTISCGKDSFTVSSGNYSWTSRGVNGEMGSVVACGSHPLDGRFSEEFHHITGKTITLSFPMSPDSVTILRWPADHMDEMDFAGDIVLADNLNLTVEDGSWVYQITAAWDRDSWSGSAEYHLYVTK